MNILFLTLVSFDTIYSKGIYTDLLRELISKGHKVFSISPIEKRYNVKTHVVKEDDSTILRLKIGNIQKTNLFEKGISTLLINYQYKKAIKEYFNGIKFDLVLYSTPPITLVECINYIKKRDNAKTYLLLKDIFPQNAVDMGFLSKNGIKSFIYSYFRNKEKKLYSISDKIGCMSDANVDYLLSHNAEVKQRNDFTIESGSSVIVEVCPNSIEPRDLSLNNNDIIAIRKKYNIPLDRKVLIYGGNLGKVQGIDFLVECLKMILNDHRVYFLIAGNGTEAYKITNFINAYKPNNVDFMPMLPINEYEKLVASSDVGLIFLNHKNTIPNFPSRLLSYMQVKIPVLAVTDKSTDIGKVIEKGDFGWWCESNDANELVKKIESICNEDLKSKGLNAFKYLITNYAVKDSVNLILA